MNPAVRWLDAEFWDQIDSGEVPPWKPSPTITVRPMVELLSAMDGGPAMDIHSVDYKDPERVWL